MPSKESIAVILGAIALVASKKVAGSKSHSIIEAINRKDIESLSSNLPENQFIHFTNGFMNIEDPKLYRHTKQGEPFTLFQQSLGPDVGIYITKDVHYGDGWGLKNAAFLCIIEVEDDNLFPDEDWIGWRIVEELKGIHKYPLSETYTKIGKRVIKQYGDIPYPFLGDKTFNQLINEENIYLDWAAPFGIRANKVMTQSERMSIIDNWRKGNLERYGGMEEIYPNEFFIPDPENTGIKPVKVFKIVD